MIFDNSYSLLRNKKIHYCVYVTLPLNKLNILPSDGDLPNDDLDNEKGNKEASVSEKNGDTNL